MAYSYPILLELAGKLVVIVGGGRAAVRKAEGLIEGGATKVRCIAPEIEDQMPAEVEKINVRFVPSHVDGAALVFAATSSAETNIDVVRAARERGILVARVGSEGDVGDFVTPANWRTGQIIVSVSTGSPTLSKTLRDEIEASIISIDKYAEMAEMMQKLRPWLLNSALPPSKRLEALFDLARKPALDALAHGGGEGLYRWLVERYPQLKLEKAP